MTETTRKNEGRKRLKKDAVAYKGGKCQVCGYNKCVAALHFHHRIKVDKKFHLSITQKTSLISVKDELDKCDLLCANCHAEIEHGCRSIIGSAPHCL